MTSSPQLFTPQWFTAFYAHLIIWIVLGGPLVCSLYRDRGWRTIQGMNAMAPGKLFFFGAMTGSGLVACLLVGRTFLEPVPDVFRIIFTMFGSILIFGGFVVHERGNRFSTIRLALPFLCGCGLCVKNLVF